MAEYTKDNVPTTTSWVQDLNAQQAKDQCIAWDIAPKELLEENRVLLKSFIKQKKLEKTAQANTDQSVQPPFTAPPSTPETQAPPLTTTPQATTSTSTGLGNMNFEQLKQMVETIQQSSVNIALQAVKEVTTQLSTSFCNKSAEEFTMPSFISDMLKELKPTTGNEPDSNIEFIKKLTKIINMKQATEKSVILQAIPYTQDRLREFWTQMVGSQADWKTLIKSFLSTFFTSDTLREAENRFLYRKQTPTEHLSEFVLDIQLMFSILAPSVSEESIFQTIFRNVNEQTRLSFAGTAPITTVQDLLKIAPFSSSVRTPSHTNYHNNGLNSTTQNRTYYYQPRQYLHYTRPRPQYAYSPQPRFPQHHQQTRTFFNQYRPRPNESTARAYTPGFLDNSQHIMQRRQLNHLKLLQRRTLGSTPPQSTQTTCTPAKLCNSKNQFTQTKVQCKQQATQVNFASGHQVNRGETTKLNPCQVPTNTRVVIAPLDDRADLVVKFGSQEAKALVDSGASCSIISRHLLEVLMSSKDSSVRDYQSSRESAITANLSHMPFFGVATIHFKIDHLSWTYKFYVADTVTVDVILGADFLRYSHAVINLAKQQITFPYKPNLALSTTTHTRLLTHLISPY